MPAEKAEEVGTKKINPALQPQQQQVVAGKNSKIFRFEGFKVSGLYGFQSSKVLGFQTSKVPEL